MTAITDASALHEAQPRGPLYWIQRILTQYTIQCLLLVVVIGLSLTNDNFRQEANILSVLRQASFAGIGAAGMTLLIINGAFDLSVAGLLGLCGVVLAQVLPDINVLPTVLLTVVLGTALGVANGLVVTKIKIPAFIATLGMMYVYLAIGFIITDGQVVPVTNKAFRNIGTGDFLGLPIPFVIMVVTYVVLYGIMQYTTYGRFIRAVGSSENASFVGGIPVDRVKIFAFALVGLCTGLAAVALTGYLSSAQPIMAEGYELRVIAAAVVGGTSLKGGSGTLFGTFTGAMFFTVINNALNLFNVGAYWQYVAVGMIIITALGIEALRHRFGGVFRGT
ncbi:MAG TPA: ABC transporter permease [Aggregatilinea sp.]|jgi:ribose transport system permease protein|uniref:ABC transporter permease n=1 Tax=Aggregatilinea sp. TaxID=2806333 RepID=UPI002C35849C|nr:ABC transporter permease [Aggregatilinea sp.]HML24793.1 ABC transporter permease [Aggregatilinea sp.]